MKIGRIEIRLVDKNELSHEEIVQMAKENARNSYENILNDFSKGKASKYDTSFGFGWKGAVDHISLLFRFKSKGRNKDIERILMRNKENVE